MNLRFIPVENDDKIKVFALFKSAAEKIAKLNVDHWQYWKNPPEEKIKWVTEGIENGEFFFINNLNDETIGMVRILNEDLLYWGKQDEPAKYVHSLVVKEKYNGMGLGAEILCAIGKDAKKHNCCFLRLDADSKNPKLCNYYENLGFEKVGNKELPLSTYILYQKKIL